MEIYGINNNVYEAIDAIIEKGIAVIEGSKTSAVNYANKIIKCLSAYPEISPSIGYQNVPKNGYLYYVCDLSKFPIGSLELEEIINKIDAVNA